MRKIRGLTVFLFLLLASATLCLAASYKICEDSGQCHNCDYYDAQGVYLYSIYWCFDN